MTEWEKRALATRDRLNTISPSYCIAKWTQVTLHLQSGLTHSCHHPVPHKIPLSELEANPGALHNTKHKQEQRRKMLHGERPAECDFCWKIEDSGADQISDRYLKSQETWSEPFFTKYSQEICAQNVLPSAVEVSFSNKCNFKCAYCSPDISSKWMEESKEFGPYPTHPSYNNLHYFQVSSDRMPIADQEQNPYVDAFWKWWPELLPGLKVFRITGGEPLLSPNTFRVFEELLRTPQPELSLAINTNLGVPKVLVQKLASLVKKMKKGENVKDFMLFTSLDSWGEQAEYIRTGLKMELFLENMRFLLEELPDLPIVIMCTFNALSVVGFSRMVEEVYKLKEQYQNRVSIDTSFLRYPTFFTVNLLTPEYQEILQSAYDRMQQLSLYWDHEKVKVLRTLEWMRTPIDPQTLENEREDFFIFFKEYDRRRGLSFLSYFPEMKNFWELCENIHKQSKRAPWS